MDNKQFANHGDSHQNVHSMRQLMMELPDKSGYGKGSVNSTQNPEPQRSQRYIVHPNRTGPPQPPSGPPPSQQPLSPLERKFLQQQQQQQQQQYFEQVDQTNILPSQQYTVDGNNFSRIPVPVSPRNFNQAVSFIKITNY